MATARLDVIIDGEASGLNSSLNSASDAVQDLGNDIKKSIDGKPFDDLNKSIQKTKNSVQAVNGLSKATDNASKSVRKFKVNTLDLSRVIQDLPFGFTAISNNLTQLIPGVGALGLAFSGLVAALTFAQVGTTFWSRKSKDDIKSVGEETETLKERNERLKKAFDDAASSALGEADKLNQLGRALSDTTGKTQLLTEATIKNGLARFLFTEKESLATKLLSDAIEGQLKGEKAILKLKESEFKVRQKIAGTQAPLRIAGVDELKAPVFIR